MVLEVLFYIGFKIIYLIEDKESCLMMFVPLILLLIMVFLRALFWVLFYSSFILMIFSSSSLIKLLLYADDIVVYISGKNVNNLITSLNNELILFNNWFIKNCLSLNINKSNFIIFHSCRKVIECNSSLSINNISFNRVSSIRYLGVLIDEHLSWLTHISYVQNHVSRNIGIISRIRPFVNTKVALLLYFSLVYPYITYCNIIWASTYNTHLHQLNVLQKRIIRIIFLLTPLSSTVSAFTNNSLLNISQIRNLQTALFI